MISGLASLLRGLVGTAAQLIVACSCAAATPGIYFTIPGGFNTNGSVARTDLNGANLQTLVEAPVVTSLAVDPTTDRIFYRTFDDGPAAIWQADAVGGNAVVLIDSFGLSQNGMDFDPIGQRLFASSGGQAFAIDISNPELDPYNVGLNGIVDIEYDASIDTLLLANATSGLGDSIRVYRGDDRLGVEVVEGLTDLAGMGLNAASRHIYYTAQKREVDIANPFSRVIYRSDLDGSNEIIWLDQTAEGRAEPRDIEVAPQLRKVFWTDDILGGIWHANFDGSSVMRLTEVNNAKNVKVVVPEPSSAAMLTLIVSGAVVPSLLVRNRR